MGSTTAAPDIVLRQRHNEGVLEMTEPQVWTMIVVFGTLLAGGMATVSGLFIRVVRSEIGGVRAEISGLRGEMGSEIGGLRAEMRAEIGGLRAEMNARFEAVDARFDSVDTHLTHLDRDVTALSKRVFGADQP